MWYDGLPIVGRPSELVRDPRSSGRPDVAAGRSRGSPRSFPPIAKDARMANSNDPFSTSVIPFEVPEQVRAFAEKGVSQARESYSQAEGRRRDPQRHHRGGVHLGQQGRQRLFRQAARHREDQHRAPRFDFAQSLVGAKTPAGSDRTVDLARQKQVETADRADQGTGRTVPEGRHRHRRADQGQRSKLFTPRRLIAARRQSLRKPGRSARAFCCWR